MPLQHDAFERRASAWAAVCNQLKCTGHSLEFHPEECVGLVSGHIRRWIKKAFHCLKLGNASHKFECEFDVELHGTDDDRKLMARIMHGAKRRGLQKLTVRCREFASRFAFHRSISLVSSLY